MIGGTDEGACARCGGTGFVIHELDGVRRARPCECRRAAQGRPADLQEYTRAARIPERYHDCDFQNYDPIPPYQLSLQGARTWAMRYVEEYPFNDRGLLLMGQPGVGKTHLAVATLRRLALDKGVGCLFCDVQDLLRQLQATFDRQSGLTELELLHPVLQTEVVLLDDLGGRQFTPWVEETLSHIVTTRYNQRRATIVTTNYMDEPKETRDQTLKDRIGPRTYSRLREMCHFVRIDADDYRMVARRADFHSLPPQVARPKENA